MSLRCARSVGPAVLAFLLGAALAGGLLPTTPAGATGGGTALSLLWQTATVQPAAAGPTTFTLDLAIGASAGSGADVAVTLYQKLTTRSSFEQTLNATPSESVLDRTDPVAVSSLAPGTHRGLALGIDVEAPGAAAPTAGAPTLDLSCTSTCTGVYPAVVALFRPGQETSPIARFTTYLTYVESRSTATTALRFAWVVPISTPVSIRSGRRDPAKAITPPTHAETTTLEGLVTSLHTYPAVPVTLEPSPQTLQALAAAGSAGRKAVEELAELATHDAASHQISPQPYVPIDLGALAGAGEGGEITGQMTQGAAVLHTLGIPTSDDPASWVAAGPVGSALGTGLAQPAVGAQQVVVPDADLTPDTSSADQGTWTSSFQLAFGKGGRTFTAAASDSELGNHFVDDPADPALEAEQLLADLAMIHFEYPYATGRGVVAVPKSGWTPSTAFDDALLAGLATNPVVTAVTLDGLFSSVHDAGARHLQTGGPGPSLPKGLAHQITTSRLRLTGFDTAVVPRSTPVLTQLDQLLLASEADNLSPAAQAAGVGTFNRSLAAQLAQITFATGDITLTARTGSIPITIVSHAPYTVVGTLTVSSDKFQFPAGSSQPLTIDRPTTPIRIQVEARTSGDLPIQVELETSNGSLVIAQSQLTVRSTATSIVGIVLTAAALLVLLAWWARTWRAGRRSRRAARARRDSA